MCFGRMEIIINRIGIASVRKSGIIKYGDGELINA
jgi:hypothetical protein